MAVDTEIWYYKLNGVQYGPLLNEGLQKLVDEKTVLPTTLITNGNGNWIELRYSSFTKHLARANPQVQAQMRKRNTMMMWAVALLPLLALLLDLLIGKELRLAVVLASFCIMFLNKSLLESAGLASPSFWSIFFPPLYLWRNAALLRENKILVGVWLVCCAIFFAGATSVLTHFFT